MNANTELSETKHETKLNDTTRRTSITLWLVDDSDMLREVLAENFAHEKGIVSVRQFSSAEAAIETLLTAAPPDVILLDLNMRGMSGVEALPVIKRIAPGTRVLIFTTFYDSHAALAAFRAGASGFLLKSYDFKRVCDCVADAREAWPYAWFKTRAATDTREDQQTKTSDVVLTKPKHDPEPIAPTVSLFQHILGFFRRQPSVGLKT